MNLNGPIIRATSKRSETANESAIIDDLPVLICKLDQEGNIIYVNKSYRSFLGKSNEEILGNQFQYFDKEALNKNNFENSASKKQFSLKLDGDKIRWIEWKINKIANDSSDNPEYYAIGNDVTEFKLLEEQLSKILVAVEQSLSTVVITDKQGNIEYVNPSFTEKTGYTFEEIKGSNTRILKGGQTKVEVYSTLWGTITSGDVWQGELLNKKKNGELFWELATISPVKNEDGVITNYIAIKEDITERKKFEKMQDAVYKISHLVISTDSLPELYESIHKILSYVLPVENFYIAIYNEEKNLLSFPYFVDQFDEPSPEQTPGRGLTEYVLRTGSPCLVTPEVFNNLVEEKEVDLVGTDSLDWLGVPLKINNKTIGVIVVQSYSENIRLTEQEKDILIYVSDQIALAIERTKTLDLLRSSEERYRLIFDKAADLIVIIDAKGKVLDLNNIFEIETGYKRENIIGKNIFNVEFLTSKSVVTTAFYISQIMLDKEVPIFEIEGIKADGNPILYELRAVPIIEDGKKIGVQAILRNISERKKTEALLQQSQKQLSNLMFNLPGMAYRCKFDESWTMEFVSQGCLDLTGYRPDELILNKGIAYADLIHPEDREKVYVEIINSIKHRKPFQILYRIRTKDRQEKWVWEKGGAILDKKRQVEAVEGFITDISSRVNAEQALKESEELYRKLIATLPDVIMITDLNGDIVFMNDVGIKLSGYQSFEEIKHKNLSDFIYDEDSEISNNFKSIFPLNSKRREFAFRNILGATYLLEIQREILRNPDNSPYGLIFSCRDITLRKKTEIALSQSEEKYRTLMDSIQDGVFSIEKEILTYANRALCEMIGYDIKETIGFPFAKFIAPEDMEMVRRNYSLRQKGLDVPGSYEFRMLHKDGKRVYVNLSARIVDYHGTKTTIGTLKDVTTKRELEQILLNQKNLFKCVADAAHILLTETNFDQAINRTLQSLGQSSDIDRVYLFENSVDVQSGEIVTNQKYEWTNGLVSAEINNQELQNLHYLPVFKEWFETLDRGEVINSNINDLSDPLKSFLEEESIKSVLIVPIMVRNKFWGFIGFDSCQRERLWNESEISILKTTASNLGGLLEREASKKELIEAKETAEVMNKLKSNFLANMSHELRTPLIAILGYTEILGSEINNQEWGEMIDTVMQSGKRLLETLNLILDLSKIEADKVQIDKKNLNLFSEINEIIILLKPVADKKNLYLKLNSSEKNIFAKLDKRFFNSIITNLINNGIKYTHKGGVTIDLEAFQQNGNSFVTIKVSDTGIGIAPEDQKIIFDEFRQVSEGYNRKFEGSGLGLTITKKFVEKMDGKISLESSPDDGSVFTIIFPVEDNNKGINTSEAKVNDFKINSQVLGNRFENVLIVDDDIATRKIIELFLKDKFRITSVSNIYDAIKIAETNKYSLVLMDISLGQDISGIDLLKRFRGISTYKNIPIIAVTAHAMVGDREKFILEGFDDYLSKPFTKNDLLDKIHSWENYPIKEII